MSLLSGISGHNPEKQLFHCKEMQKINEILAEAHGHKLDKDKDKEKKKSIFTKLGIA